VTLIGGLIRLQYAENEGAFLNIGGNLPAVFRRLVAIVLTIIILGGFTLLLSFAQDFTLPRLISFSLLLAGSLGNMIDRMFHQGRVVDFLIVGTKTIHTGIFNVADLLITTSIVILFITEVFRRRAA